MPEPLDDTARSAASRYRYSLDVLHGRLEQDGRLYGQGNGRFMPGCCAGVWNIAEDRLEEEAVEHFCLVIRGEYRLVAAEAEIPVEP